MAALHIEHAPLGAAPSVPEALQRQIRHIAYEFIRLKEEHYGPNSNESSFEALELAAKSLTEFFDDLLRTASEKSDLFVESAKLAEETLREIRTLRGSQHFFSETLDGFYSALSYLGVDYEQFGAALLWELHKYRQQRDKEEALFLRPFHEYRDELLRIVNNLRTSHPFGFFEVEDRIKRDLLTKLQKRQWQGMQDFFDVVGVRIIVGNQREVDAAVALVEGAIKVYEATVPIDSSKPHYFRIKEIEDKNNERGYRAKHVNVIRCPRDNGGDHPAAEIQVMSRGIDAWGKIQRLLVYKIEGLPENVSHAVGAYCRSSADYIVARENGIRTDAVPEIDIMILTHIVDDALRSDVLDRLCDMDVLVRGER